MLDVQSFYKIIETMSQKSILDNWLSRWIFSLSPPLQSPQPKSFDTAKTQNIAKFFCLVSSGNILVQFK